MFSNSTFVTILILDAFICSFSLCQIVCAVSVMRAFHTTWKIYGNEMLFNAHKIVSKIFGTIVCSEVLTDDETVTTFTCTWWHIFPPQENVHFPLVYVCMCVCEDKLFKSTFLEICTKLSVVCNREEAFLWT